MPMQGVLYLTVEKTDRQYKVMHTADLQSDVRGGPVKEIV